MRTQSKTSHRQLAKITSAALSALAGLVLTSCLDQTPAPLNKSTGSAASSGSSSPVFGGTSTGVSASDATYAAKSSVKVILNKNNFYNNLITNSQNCAGDARFYFDPITDRRVPTKPSWLKNISVDLTNSNAFNGPSRATSCSLSGLGASQAANCAAFDDLQPLSGAASRTVVVGGRGCLSSGSACDPTYYLSDTWILSTSDVSTAATWGKQSTSLPQPDTATGPGLAFHGADFDELHDKVYVFGGSRPHTTNTAAAGTQEITNKVIEMVFGADRSLSSALPPSFATISTNRFYAGWNKSGNFNTNLASYDPTPPAMVGSSFTYGLRRDPTTKSYCRNTDTLNVTDTCEATKFSTNSTYAVGHNEHEDYYLLVGGMQSSALNDGIFSKNFYLYKPHSLSNDIGAPAAPTGGDWMLLSNAESGNPTGLGLSNKVMSIVDLAPTGVTSAPYKPTFVGSTRPSAAGLDVFSGWMGRAFHRTVYDSTMNRFYIFGGLINQGAYQNAAVSAFSNVADVATSDIWIYDPPALGRRPTSACFTTMAPDAQTLPTSTALGASRNLGPNRAYTAGNFVFPPGGCLQRVSLPTSGLTGRFEHSMAFDRDQKAVIIFGGCTQAPSTIPQNLTADAGNPVSVNSNCTAATMKNDTWMYLPPTTTEIVPQSYSDASTTNPFNSSYLIPNVFGTAFWLDHLPLFSGDGSSVNAELTVPTQDQTLGVWINLTPSPLSNSTSPGPRASASMTYDRAHHKFYLQGGYGCANIACAGESGPHALNDLWEFTPPDIATDCSRTGATCYNSLSTNGFGKGVWKKLMVDRSESLTSQPTQRFGATMMFAEPMFSHGDDFYTVTDAPCLGQGPIASTDATVSKQLVGAIYVDIDRAQLSSKDNLLINLRFLPFDNKTKLPGYFDNNTPSLSVDDTDAGSTNDIAVLRVQYYASPLSYVEQILSLIQPRYHEYISAARVRGDTVMYVSGASGQVTEKQILVPLTLDSTINMIKIERIQGSAKFYELTVSKF